MDSIPRLITTIDELEALPVGAVIVDNTNHAWARGASRWWASHPYDQDHLNSPIKMEKMLLVYLPEMMPR